MAVRQLKRLLQKATLFGVPAVKQRLVMVDEGAGNLHIPLDDDMKELSFFSVVHDAVLEVHV